MKRPRLSAAGGLQAIKYIFDKALDATGGLLELVQRLGTKNACKTCALGMGGQRGGMVNEKGAWPEVCKKSIQAQAGDMQAPITESFFREHSLAELATKTPAQMEALGRLGFPIIALPGDTHFRRITWDEALNHMGAAFREASPHSTFVYSSGRSSNEAAFLLQLVARAYGTPHIHNCSFYCHAASGVALNKVYGSGTASVVLEDLEHADCAIVQGANPASNHPRLITQLVALRRRGGKVLVINPVRELGLMRFRIPSDWRSMISASQVSDLYLQPHIGGDIPLLKALLKGVLERGATDSAFIAAHTDGFDAVAGDLAHQSWDSLVHASGVSKAEIDRAVDLIVAARSGIAMWAMGLTHHAHGVDNVLALANLCLARGWLGRRGAGLLPIRGHSNVQGVGSVGVSPIIKDAFAHKLETLYGIQVPREPGQDTYASMVAAKQGQVRAALLLGGNLYGSNPDLAWAAAALNAIPFMATLTTKLNPGHVLGRGQTSVVLPVLARDEEPQPTTQESMFNFVRLSDGGQPSVMGEMRSEVEILADWATRILPAGRFDWSKLKSHAALRQAMAQVVPGFSALAEIDATRREFQIAGRTFHSPTFATPNGKAQFHVTPAPDFTVAPGEFRLMTLRSEGQFNTVVYEEIDLYRGVVGRDVVLMAPVDAAKLGVADGDRVIVRTAVGEMRVRVFTIDIRPGNLAMYFPEANVLVPRCLDPRSKTPAFKSVAARVERV